MRDAPGKSPDHGASFTRRIGAKVARKLRARRSRQVAWSGLGMMGLIGGSVVVPTLAGAALGAALDRRHPGRSAWTLGLLLAGLLIGCVNAWFWVVQQDRAMREEPEDGDE